MNPQNFIEGFVKQGEKEQEYEVLQKENIRALGHADIDSGTEKENDAIANTFGSRSSSASFASRGVNAADTNVGFPPSVCLLPSRNH